MSSLFRKEAVEAQRQRLFGQLLAAPPPMSGRLTILFGALVAGFAIVLWGAEYRQSVTVSGELALSEGLIRVPSPVDGTLMKYFVQPGQEVAAGDMLAAVNTETALEGKTSREDEIISSIQSQEELLQSRISLEAKRLRESEASHAGEIEDLRQQLKGLDEEIALTRQYKSTVEADLERALKLKERGYVTQAEVSRRMAESVNVQREILSLQRNQKTIKEALEQSGHKARIVRLEATARMEALRSQYAALSANRAGAEADRRIIVRASVSGVVADRHLQPGQNARTGTSLMTLLPRNNTLVADLKIPSHRSGKIAKGQSVLLEVDAFPRKDHGYFVGEVLTVSVTPAPHPLEAEGHPEGAFYRVLTTLPPRPETGREVTLRPGMSVRGKIVLGESRVADWLLNRMGR